MNKATAKHLNELRQLAEPIKLDIYNLQIEHYAVDAVMAEKFNGIWKSHIPESLAEEIREAAKSKRECSTICGDISYYAQGFRISANDNYGFSKLVRQKSFPEFEAYIEVDNARRLAEYEAYRLACEQGVAVPPS